MRQPTPIVLAAFDEEIPDNLDTDSESHSPYDAHDSQVGRESLFAGSAWEQAKLDAPEYLPGVWEDTKAIVNWHNTAWVLGATGVALSLRGEADDGVRRATARHPDRWGDGSHVLGKLGEVQWQVPMIALVYSNSIWTNDTQLYDFSKSLISAYTITSVGTVALKGIVNTERPSAEWNDGEFGFPSYHTSSSFTIAAVIEEYYGIENAAPWYVLAGLIGWSRIDERDHDLSDVVFGAMFGYIIGKSVAASHLHDDPRVRIRPTYSQLDESYGVSFETSY
ncbi:MAG: phosphatase PAP2 family protein [Planctomycetaceae bacterium]